MGLTAFLKQSTAITVTIGPFVDATDGFTAETGLTISQADVRLSKNGAAFAQKNNADAATHMENGVYSCNLSTTDTNTLGVLTLVVNESGARPVRHDYMVVPANIWDSWFGADKQLVDVGEWVGTTVTLAGTTGKPEVDVFGISDSSEAANDLEASAETIVTGAAVAGTLSTTQMTTNLTESTNEHYTGRVVIWSSGNLKDQASAITAYDGATKKLTYNAVTDIPIAGDTFLIV